MEPVITANIEKTFLEMLIAHVRTGLLLLLENHMEYEMDGFFIRLILIPSGYATAMDLNLRNRIDSGFLLAFTNLLHTYVK